MLGKNVSRRQSSSVWPARILAGVALLSLIIGVAFLLVTLRSACQNPDLKAAFCPPPTRETLSGRTLTVGVSNSSAPFSFADINQTLAGFEIELLEMIEDYLVTKFGISKIEFTPISPTERLKAAQDGRFDMVIGANSYTEERCNESGIVCTTVSHYSTQIAVLFNPNLGAQQTFNDFNDFCGMLKNIESYGGLPGTTGLDQAKSCGIPQTDLKPVERPDRCTIVKDVMNGDIHIYISDEPIVQAYANAVGSTQIIQIIPNTPQDYIIYLPDKYEEFRDVLNEAIRNIMQGSAYRSLLTELESGRLSPNQITSTHQIC